MPSLQEIEQFKTILNELGEEPELLAERGEEIEDVPPPEQGLPEGLRDLLETPEGAPAEPVFGAAEEEQPAAFPETPAEQEVDLSDLLGEEGLSGLDSLEGAGPPEGEPEAAAEPEAPAEEFSLEDFGIELPGQAAPEEGSAGQALGDLFSAEVPGGGEGAEEQAGEEDEFTLPPGLLGPIEAPEEGEAAEEEAPEAEAGFELPEEFTFPAEEEAPAEEAPAEEAPAEEAVEAEAEFELPEEFTFPTEEEAAQPGEQWPELPEAAEQGPAEAPEFEIPEEQEREVEEEIGAEELPEMPGFDSEGFDAEAPEAEEGEAEEPFVLPEAEAAAGEGEAFGAEAAGGEAPAGEAFGEEEFALPEEFQLPEEPFGEEPAAGEAVQEVMGEEEGALAEPSEEEAEFLKVLQDQILPGEESAAEEEAEVPAETFEEFAEIPLETEAAPEAPEAFPAGMEAAFPEGEQVDLEAPVGAEESAEEFELDEFSLEGLGEAFAVEEHAEEPTAPEEEIPAAVPGVEEQFPEEIAVPTAEELTFTDKQFVAIKRTLARLPRNLKIAIEELIAEKGLAGEELRSLLALLIEGAAPAAIAERVSRLTGQRIVLPRVFERLTGVAFEERRRTFGYAFRENILPILRVVLLSLGFLGLLTFLGYRYVYKPLYANYLYRQGYTQIEKERYRMANDSFDKATSVWVFKNWYYRYSEGFTGQKQFQLAAEKYEQLLRRFPEDRRGKLSYASLLTFHLAGYERAEKLLDEVLAEDMKDYEALLAKGDNYLEWAQDDESRYEDARFAYASIIDYYGERDEVLLRMLRYFVHMDKFEETRNLKAHLDSKKNLRVDAQLYALTCAELAGYWIDKGRYDSIPDMLFKAMDMKMNEPGIHYQLARYYRYVREPRKEEEALETAVVLLEEMQPLDKKHLFMLIDSYNRRGETFWRKEEYLEAEEYFQKAIARIEDAQGRRIFGQEEEFGPVYKNYGDIYYYISYDLEPALDLYLKALNNRYETPDLNYKIGYIHYAADRYEDALLGFSKVVDQRPSNENGLFALANSLYLRGYYSSAQGYYLRLLDLLESREERIPYLQIYENPEHNALVEYIMKVYNNLGVTLKQLADRSRDPVKESKALVDMTFSSERFDLLSRDPLTVERGLTKNLAYLNQRGILYPASDFQLQIYTRLPIDLQSARF